MVNRLINEQSPYLLQHAHNPVDWYPWGDEAFEIAQRDNKPLIVSIGYAACHWCHVMERESFEDASVAAYMNEHFVCIKVDREEHPDVDHMYMDAVQAISGSGGWPLNVFVTPARVPFYGGTYYPPRQAYNRPSWMQLLQRMNEIWSEQREEVDMQSKQMLQYLKQASEKTFGNAEKELTDEVPKSIADSLLKQADTEKGGFGNAPKFPGTMAISFLLEYHHFYKDEHALRHALRSLDAMIEGGIYDQLGGGFARYATDRDWLVPHFEKMLYDNALIICALADAFAVTGKERYKEVIEETIRFAERELKDSSGVYYCALDADSEGIEGKFYTWTWEEFAPVAGVHCELLRDHFGISDRGNWEGVNILHVAMSIEDVAAKYKLSNEEVVAIVAEVKNKLFEIRSKRQRPLTDDKALLSWNSLMNIALTRTAAVLNSNEYVVIAEAHMNAMERCFMNSEGWRHTYKNGVARISPKLDDLAYLAQAQLQLASVSANNELIKAAADLCETVIEQFDNSDTYFYFTSSRQQDIPVRKTDIYDGATPSANAVMANNLLILGLCMERTEWFERGRTMLAAIAETTARYSYSFGYWAILIQRMIQGIKTVLFTGQSAVKNSEEVRLAFVPQVFLITFKKEIFDVPLLKGKYSDSKNYTFVCTENACFAPVLEVKEAIKQINRQ